MDLGFFQDKFSCLSAHHVLSNKDSLPQSIYHLKKQDKYTELLCVVNVVKGTSTLLGGVKGQGMCLKVRTGSLEGQHLLTQ